MKTEELKQGKKNLAITRLAHLSPKKISELCRAFETEIHSAGYTPEKYAKLVIEYKTWLNEVESWFKALEKDFSANKKIQDIILVLREEIEDKNASLHKIYADYAILGKLVEDAKKASLPASLPKNERTA
ncbi:hypothetical protein J4417_02975 [Candidatus Woesearchaeota archaeon]|nr:hypothetical protein [Candidatus Woesearchaeota archaeon]